MSDNKSLIKKIGKILTLVLFIFKNCRMRCNLCSSTCVIGDQAEETEDIEIHKVKKIQHTLANEAKDYHKNILGYDISEV